MGESAKKNGEEDHRRYPKKESAGGTLQEEEEMAISVSLLFLQIHQYLAKNPRENTTILSKDTEKTKRKFIYLFIETMGNPHPSSPAAFVCPPLKKGNGFSFFSLFLHVSGGTSRS